VALFNRLKILGDWRQRCQSGLKVKAVDGVFQVRNSGVQVIGQILKGRGFIQGFEQVDSCRVARC
jgi:hypothetical protein